jgi:type VI secretion system protein ImpG
VSPYLLGLILAHYMTQHVSINSLTQIELDSMQRGRIACWPVRIGAREVA